MKKFLCGLLALLLVLGAFSGFTACNGKDNSSSSSPTDISDYFLRVEGTNVVDGEGNIVYLRGVNSGGLGVIEQWMNGFTQSSSEESSIVCIDHLTTSKVFIERFGMDGAKELWAEYQENWFNETDFANCAAMGMNVIRFPFTYMNVDFDAVSGLEYAGKNYDFTLLDYFVETAANYGLYTILDLHGAYGSQNGKDHSGEVQSAGSVDFYSNQQKQDLTANLWKAIAEHFKDNPYVAGYDILNEPAETTGSGTMTTELRHWIVFDKIYDAIRSVDQNHIVIFESCWDGKNLPQPSTYGWENCMYSFHHYTGTSDYDGNTVSWNAKLDEVISQDFGVPLYMGEFTCYNNADSWNYCLDLMAAQGWHWTSWTYKVNATSVMPWGIYNIQVSRDDKINAHLDSYDTIIEKMQGLRTTEYAKPYAFSDGQTLYSIFHENLHNPVEILDLSAGRYWIRTPEYNALTTSNTILQNYTVVTEGNGKWDGFDVYLSNDANEEFSVYLKMQNYYFSIVDNGSRAFLTLSKQETASARFFLVKAEDGYKILSYATRKYLRYDENNKLFYADANKENAKIFFIETA